VSASIGANIAEGYRKRGNAEFRRFLRITTGSASELEYHFLLAYDLRLLNESNCEKLNAGIVEIKRKFAL
jgi:four helix bundle protein